MDCNAQISTLGTRDLFVPVYLELVVFSSLGCTRRILFCYMCSVVKWHVVLFPLGILVFYACGYKAKQSLLSGGKTEKKDDKRRSRIFGFLLWIC